MPDGGGGGQQQQSFSQNNGQTGPSPVIAPKLENILDNFWGWYNQHGQAPAYYPGNTVAPMSTQTQQALSALSNRGLNGSAATNAGQTALTDTLTGKYLDINNNPYFQSALSAAFAPQTENLMNTVLPGIDSKFAGSGRTAGGAHIDTTMRAVNDLNRTQSQAAATAALGAYQGERSNMQGSLGLLPSFNQMDLSNLGAAYNAGNAYDTFAQRNLDADIERYNYNQNAQADWYMRMAQMVQGIYPGGQSWGTSSGTSMTPSRGGSAVGTGMAIAGLGLQAAKFLPMMSDERLKDVHARVGFTDDGLPLYLYTYKGRSEPRIGPLAQDVAETKPDAVAKVGDFLAVDYAKLAPEGGLL